MVKVNEVMEYVPLPANASQEEITKLCSEAIANNLTSICVSPNHIKEVKRHLSGSKVKLSALIGFPLGLETTSTKLYAAQKAIDDGADEIDVVLDINAFKGGNYGYVEQELVDMRKLTQGLILKVIIETNSLNNQELVTAVQLATEANADFIRTVNNFNKISGDSQTSDSSPTEIATENEGGILIMQTRRRKKSK